MGKGRDKPEPKVSLIQRAAHRLRSAVEHVGVNHRGFNVFMPKQFLYGTDVVPGLQQMCGKAMAEGVRADGLINPGQGYSRFNRPL